MRNWRVRFRIRKDMGLGCSWRLGRTLLGISRYWNIPPEKREHEPLAYLLIDHDSGVISGVYPFDFFLLGQTNEQLNTLLNSKTIPRRPCLCNQLRSIGRSINSC